MTDTKTLPTDNRINADEDCLSYYFTEDDRHIWVSYRSNNTAVILENLGFKWHDYGTYIIDKYDVEDLDDKFYNTLKALASLDERAHHHDCGTFIKDMHWNGASMGRR